MSGGVITLRFDHATFGAGRVQGFSSIWAFYVNGFDHEKHCQLTRLLLVNAVTFAARWASEFLPYATREQWIPRRKAENARCT